MHIRYGQREAAVRPRDIRQVRKRNKCRVCSDSDPNTTSLSNVAHKGGACGHSDRESYKIDQALVVDLSSDDPCGHVGTSRFATRAGVSAGTTVQKIVSPPGALLRPRGQSSVVAVSPEPGDALAEVVFDADRSDRNLADLVVAQDLEPDNLTRMMAVDGLVERAPVVNLALVGGQHHVALL
jgi:hypothetical protein